MNITEKQQQAIEAIVNTKPLNEYPVQPMTGDQTKLFAQFTLLSKENPVMDAKLLEALKSGSRMFMMIHTRCEAFGLSVSPYVLAFIADELTLCIPGHASNYVFAIAKYMYERKLSEFTWNDFVNMFPIGFPTRESLVQAWDNQKIIIEGEFAGNAADNLSAFGFKQKLDDESAEDK